jgi:hypothetical protein
MNTEQIQALIEMLSGAGEGVKAVLILYLTIPALLTVINWCGITLLVCFIIKGVRKILAVTSSGSGRAFSESELRIMRDQLKIGCSGCLTDREVSDIKEAIKLLVFQEATRNKG